MCLKEPHQRECLSVRESHVKIQEKVKFRQFCFQRMIGHNFPHSFKYVHILKQLLQFVEQSLRLVCEYSHSSRSLFSLGKLNRRQLDLYLSRKTFRLLSKGLHQFVRISRTSPH